MEVSHFPLILFTPAPLWNLFFKGPIQNSGNFFLLRIVLIEGDVFQTFFYIYDKKKQLLLLQHHFDQFHFNPLISK